MYATNRDGLAHRWDYAGSNVAMRNAPAIPGLAGTTRKLLAVVRRVL
jgi:hypothetical protein